MFWKTGGSMIMRWWARDRLVFLMMAVLVECAEDIFA